MNFRIFVEVKIQKIHLQFNFLLEQVKNIWKNMVQQNSNLPKQQQKIIEMEVKTLIANKKNNFRFNKFFNQEQ